MSVQPLDAARDGDPATSPARGGPDTAGTRCTCAHDGGAARCPFHTQADYDSARPDTAGMREAIENALWRYSFGGWVTSSATVGDVARTLLPVVQLLAAKEVAEELRAMGRAALRTTPGAAPVTVPVGDLFERADALAAAAQPTDGRTGE